MKKLFIRPQDSGPFYNEMHAAGLDMPDKIKFSFAALPLLFELDKNRQLNESVKYNCCKSIKYARGNNIEGTIIAVPSFLNSTGCNKE
jgi:hypothetical protein